MNLYKKESGIDVSDKKKARANFKLEACKVKEQFVDKTLTKAEFNIDWLNDGEGWQATITREKFYEICQPIFDKMTEQLE